MKRLRENAMLEAEIGENGDVVVEGHNVGKLLGFRFSADNSATGPEAKAANAAAMRALASEIEKRASRLAACPNSDVVLGEDGTLRWMGQAVARVVANKENVLSPGMILLADEQLTGPALEKVTNRLERWLANHIENLLRPLVELSRDETISGTARGLAFQLAENFGAIDRRVVASEVKQLDQDARATLRRHGVRFGAFHIFLPLLLKPAPIGLVCLLWATKNEKLGAAGLSEIPQMSATGRTSTEVNPDYLPEIYPLCGFRVLGKRAVRLDILERLADQIRPVLAWKEGSEGEKPEGAFDGRQFYVTPAMLSILGATYEDMEQVLKGLGYKSQKRLESEIIPPKEDVPPKEGAVLSEKPVQGEGDGAEEIEPKIILLWQRDFKPKRHKQNSSSQQQKSKDEGKSRSLSHKNKPQRTKRVEKVADPDSPFAKLAALKAAMKNK